MFRCDVQAEIWVYPGKGGWHFVTLPPEPGAWIKTAMTGLARPWGSLGVEAVIGQTRWRTSLFPDKKSGSLLLPIKTAVRVREGLGAGDTANLTIEMQL
ncbi:DUF1905 domain-containing protein [Mesorhizobium sp. M1005]|uniref:DUF1905 domain-containing protein n=1 Tax=unclassified Mesorhizobium TaxID=325217 RepID=UPI0003CE95AE|nr:DUF1905 domain-containing protein [Mesorhizobium sp. LSJC280B00]ESW83008.1 hypothetical protein X772_19275 [Mesorhizobium sp. LSJC280B00]